MKKNTKIIIFSILMFIIVLLSYKLINSENLKKKTYEYLETKGCFKKQVQSIEISHSFLNLLLSYDEWNIIANLYGRYEFNFTYKNNEIILNGLNDQEKLSKEEYQDLINKLENGELCNKVEDMIGEKSKYILRDDLVSISIKEESLTNSKAILILVNHTDKSYIYGESYSIEYEKNGI